jgi:hypothetical protein
VSRPAGDPHELELRGDPGGDLAMTMAEPGGAVGGEQIDVAPPVLGDQDVVLGPGDA